MFEVVNCQAKVQVQSLKSKSKVKSKVLSQKDLDFAYSKIKQPTTHPPPPPENFSNTSRGPTVKCYTFLDTSYDPLLELQVISKFLQTILQLIFAKRENEI